MRGMNVTDLLMMMMMMMHPIDTVDFTYNLALEYFWPLFEK